MTGDWRREAACRTEDMDLFFAAEDETLPARQVREAKARSICAGCPVIETCLGFRLSFDRQLDDAIWAGKDGEERKALRHAWLKRQQRAERKAA